MSKIKDNTLKYKTEIKNGFQSLEPGNNNIIETQKLNEFSQAMNSKKKHPFIYNTIKSLTAKKEEENEENVSFEEYMSFIDNQLNDTNSNEGLKKIFSVFCEDNPNNFSWNKFAVVAKELGDDEMEKKLLKLTEQAKLYSKDVNFKEFCDIMNMEDENEKKNKNDIEYDIADYEEEEWDCHYYNGKRKNKIKTKIKEDDEEMGTNSSNKEKIDDNDNENEYEEKSNKRYHRRYRDRENKTKSDNSENGSNGTKIHYKYRKKH